MIQEKYIVLLHKKLSGQISAEESLELDRWREADSSHEAILNEYQTLWEASEEYMPHLDIDLERAKHSFFQQVATTSGEEMDGKSSRRHTRVRSLRPLMAIAASLLILISAYFLYTWRSDQGIPSFMDVNETVALADASDTDLFETLDDGSTLHFRKGTICRVDKSFNRSDRKIFLQGELFIQVVPDATKPFIIETDKIRITVLGTAFYVKSDDSDKTLVSVASGRVRVTDPEGEQMELGFGESVAFDEKSGKYLAPGQQDPVSVSQWKKDYLVFEDADLTQVFQKLSLYFGISFDLDCDRISQMSGFNSPVQAGQDPDADTYLKTIEKVYGIRIEPVSSNRYRVHGGPCR